MCLATQNRKKLLKIPVLGVQGHSRSSTLTLLRSSSLVLVIINRMSTTVYMLDETISVKYPLFRQIPLFYARLRTPP